MFLLYTLFIRLYAGLVRLVALWSPKARAWVNGRKGWAGRLSQEIAATDRVIWMHCASAGELEQGKPLIEALRTRYPAHRLLLSFFSPSGFAAAGKWAAANGITITYLPLDTKRNARRFLSIAHPELVVFVKYEYWYHHLAEVKKRNIPLLLVSAIFRPQQAFFKWYGAFFRHLLAFFTRIFVQDEESAERLRALNIDAAVAGDTRFDRVLRVIKNPLPIPLVEAMAASGPLIIAGSTWPEDEKLLASLLERTPARLVIAPHEMTKAHLDGLRRLFPGAAFYTKPEPAQGSETRVLVVDTFGLLSQLYHYATLAYIGGGFNKSGIHNTLEAAVWSKPVLFGPSYQKFKEARDLVALGAAFSIGQEEELKKIVEALLGDADRRARASEAAGAYVHAGAGATAKIMDYLQENRLLTS